MVSCSIIKCTVTRKNNPQNYTFHRIPSRSSELREKWIRIINRPQWTPIKSSVICSRHFEDKCFIQRSCRRILRKDAIPTLFVPFNFLPSRLSVTSYINRDIICETSGLQPTPGPSAQGQILSPRNTKLIGRIAEKNIILTNLREKIKMKKPLITVEEVHKEINESRELRDHRNEVQVACTNKLLQKLVDRVNSKKNKQTCQTALYNEGLKKFALTLHFYSPRCYSYIRNKFNLCLPQVNTLRKWYSRLGCEPGFTKESLDTISELAKIRPVYVSLCFDEIKIREEPELVGRKHYGYVNIGNDLFGEEIDVATEILVFMVVAVNGHWKLPVGFFPGKSFTASEKARLLKICLDLLNDANCNVISIKFDGIASNLNMVQSLGASLTTGPYKPYFIYKSRKYLVLFDPCHLIKLLRNYFGDQKFFYDSTGRKIDFKFVEKLQSLQRNAGLCLADKLTARHINFSTQKIKVATQLLSRSVAVAIDVCENDLKMAEFKDSGPTVQFLHHVNDIFDIFNSRNVNNLGFKKPLCPSNKAEVFNKLDEISEYFLSLKCQDGRLLITTQRRLVFLGFITNVIALKCIYASLIEKKNCLQYLPVYKLSQDNFETFFGAIRSNGGFNIKPTVKNFIAAYKRLLCNTEIRNSENGNCYGLDRITVLSSTIDKINSSCNYNKILSELAQDGIYDNIQHQETDFDEESVLLDNSAPLSQISKMIVTYISGHVVKQLSEKINCNFCVQSLFSNTSDLFNNSIIVERVYSDTGDDFITYPSSNVLTLCCSAESYFRENMKTKRTDIFAKTVLNLLGNNQRLFNDMKYHILDQDPLDNHRYLLMKSVIEVYFDLRLKYESKLLKLDHIKVYWAHSFK